MKYFRSSFIVTITGLILAFIWGEKVSHTSGFVALFIVSMLGILEVSLSFDNAVVNAVRLRTMSEVWQHRFLTWGMLIAVFGMRLLFPVLIVAAFSGLDIWNVAVLAVKNPEKYSHYLHQSHAAIASFGGIFLFMLFLSFVFDRAKKIHWIGIIEEKLVKMGKLEGIEIIIALISLYITQNFVPTSEKLTVLLSGISGLILYLLIDGLSNWLEESSSQRKLAEGAKQAGLISFLYLELIDASFSFDGVIGAFAISNDIVIISVGLGIGAMFVRSLTIMLVEKKSLQKYIYLEHGAHWAIGALAIIMLYTTFKEVPEIITGLIGIIFIAISFISSVIYRKYNLDKLDELTENID